MKTFKCILPIIACFISASTFAQNAIDLGLSVKWADRNLGAPTSFEYGGLYGWGDSSGNQKTENLITIRQVHPLEKSAEQDMILRIFNGEKAGDCQLHKKLMN